MTKWTADVEFCRLFLMDGMNDNAMKIFFMKKMISSPGPMLYKVELNQFLYGRISFKICMKCRSVHAEPKMI